MNPSRGVWVPDPECSLEKNMDRLEEDSQTFALKGPGFWQEETLSDRQKGELAKTMFATNADDERYLRVHPEVDYIIAAVVM